MNPPKSPTSLPSRSRRLASQRVEKHTHGLLPPCVSSCVPSTRQRDSVIGADSLVGANFSHRGCWVRLPASNVGRQIGRIRPQVGIPSNRSGSTRRLVVASEDLRRGLAVVIFSLIGGGQPPILSSTDGNRPSVTTCMGENLFVGSGVEGHASEPVVLARCAALRAPYGDDETNTSRNQVRSTYNHFPTYVWNRRSCGSASPATWHYGNPNAPQTQYISKYATHEHQIARF